MRSWLISHTSSSSRYHGDFSRWVLETVFMISASRTRVRTTAFRSSLILVCLRSVRCCAGKLPEALGNLHHLRVLNLANNELRGERRRLLFRPVYALVGNTFCGQAQDTQAWKASCRRVVCPVFESQPSGVRLTSCTIVWILRFCPGKLPDWLGELKALETLDLSGNLFEGEV